MRTLLSLCLYLALFHSAASLVCYYCMNMGKVCKNPVARTCASDEQYCVAGVGQGSFMAFSMSMSFMSCVEPQICRPGYYTASLTNSLHSHSKIYCCNTDKCNNVTITLPKDEQQTHNGLTCPSCYSLHKDSCEGRDKVQCLNNQDQCFYYGSTIHNGTQIHILAARGCSTKNACAFKTGNIHAANHSVTANITHAECYQAKPSSTHEL